MKDSQKLENMTRRRAKINPDLDRYDAMSLFQKKNEDALAFLEKHPLPNAWTERITDRRIKRDFDNNMSISAIAESHELTETEVLQRLEEMGLVEPIDA